MPRLRVTMPTVLRALIVSLIFVCRGSALESNNVIPMKIEGPLCGWKDYCNCSLPFDLLCHFEDTRTIVLTSGSFDEDVKEISLKGGQIVNITKDAFVSTKGIVFIKLEGIQQLIVLQNAFRHLKPNNLRLMVVNCNSVYFDSNAFTVEGPITANISDCGYVHMKRKTFPRILTVNIERVKQLTLEEESFFLSGNYTTSHHGPTQKIVIRDSTLLSLPRNTFRSSVHGITIENSTIATIHSNAFSAKEIAHIKLEKLTIANVEENAFPSGSLIENLTISNCTIKNLGPNAISLSGTILNLQHSRFENVSRGALDLTYAKVVMTDNIFDKIGLQIHQWNEITIERNKFKHFNAKSIICPHNSDSKMFRFSNNYIDRIENKSLEFLTEIPSNILLYENNRFETSCCIIDSWLKSIYGNESSKLTIYTENSFCVINPIISQNCNNITNNITMKNYTNIFCGDHDIYCGSSSKNVIAHKTPFIDDQLVDKDDKVIFKYVMGGLLLLALVAIVLIVSYLACRRIRRRGYCSNIKSAVTSSNSTCFTFFDRLGIKYGMDTTRSISRVSVNEYNENHVLQERRTLNEDAATLINDPSADDLVETFDKTTQTLPEELTKELLVSLREKLDDPDNYGEACEMIEHLYDLIKVEEYCNLNNNNKPSTSRMMEYNAENEYDVIQMPCRTQTGRNKKNMVSVGTNTPSFDRLPPSSPYNAQTALCHDYFEPQDHLYAELPENKYSDISSQYNLVDEVLKSTPHNYLRAIEKCMSSSRPLLNDPAPPQPVNKNLMAGPSGINSQTQRSNKSNHSVNSDDSASKMANRPLPEKPREPTSRARGLQDFSEGPPPYC